MNRIIQLCILFAQHILFVTDVVTIHEPAGRFSNVHFVASRRRCFKFSMCLISVVQQSVIFESRSPYSHLWILVPSITSCRVFALTQLRGFMKPLPLDRYSAGPGRIRSCTTHRPCALWGDLLIHSDTRKPSLPILNSPGTPGSVAMLVSFPIVTVLIILPASDRQGFTRRGSVHCIVP